MKAKLSIGGGKPRAGRWVLRGTRKPSIGITVPSSVVPILLVPDELFAFRIGKPSVWQQKRPVVWHEELAGLRQSSISHDQRFHGVALVLSLAGYMHRAPFREAGVARPLSGLCLWVTASMPFC